MTLVLVDGAGPSFSAGYDLADQREETPHGWVQSEHFDSWTDQFARSCYRDWMVLWDLLKPVVAKVHGYCLAGGTELMSMCDIAFVADDAVIGYPPMRAMSTPDTLYFPWKVSMAQAKYLQLTGNSVTGKEAAAMGWVAKSFPADDLEEQVQRELRPLAQVDPALLAANKASVNQAYELMGMRTHLQGRLAMAPADRTGSPPGRRVRRAVAREDGPRGAIEWRDGAVSPGGIPAVVSPPSVPGAMHLVASRMLRYRPGRRPAAAAFVFVSVHFPRRIPHVPVDTFFAYIGVYANVDDALDDYDAVKLLHTEAGLIDAYDAAVVERKEQRQGQDRQEARDSDPGGRGARRRRRAGHRLGDRPVPRRRHRRRTPARDHRRRGRTRGRGRARRGRNEPGRPQGPGRAPRRRTGRAGGRCRRRHAVQIEAAMKKAEKVSRKELKADQKEIEADAREADQAS